MSDLVGNPIVGFLAHRLLYFNGAVHAGMTRINQIQCFSGHYSILSVMLIFQNCQSDSNANYST